MTDVTQNLAIARRFDRHRIFRGPQTRQALTLQNAQLSVLTAPQVEVVVSWETTGAEMAPKKSTINLNSYAGYWLRYVSNHVPHAFAQIVEGKGFTVAERVLLRQIFEAVAVNPSQLAVSVGMTRLAISKLIERLCTK